MRLVPFPTAALALPLAGLALAALPLAARPLASAGAARAQAPRIEDKRAEFLQKFKQAQAAQAADEMSRLVRIYEAQSIDVIVELCERASSGSNDQIETDIESLRVAWRSAYKTEFVDNLYKYFSLLSADAKRARSKASMEYRKVLASQAGLEQRKDFAALAAQVGRFRVLAEAYAEIGDKFYESQCWIFLGRCLDEQLGGPQADLKGACEAYGRAVEARGALGLKDVFYQQTKLRYDDLVRRGLGPEGSAPAEAEQAGAGGERDGAAPSGAGGPSVALSFAPANDLEEITRPCYSADSEYASWGVVFLKEKGSTGKFPGMPESPVVLRSGSGELQIDGNQDGVNDARLVITGKTVPVQLEIGKGEEARPWSFLCVTGVDKDIYQGIELNLGPTDKEVSVYVAPAASMQGQVGSVPVRIYDDNLDGIYGSLPISWTYLGLQEGDVQWDFDSIQIGASKRARPWSELQEIGGEWYRLEPEAGGKRLRSTPETVRTGIVRLSTKGPRPEYVILHGRDSLDRCYFDLVEGGARGIAVPVGRYEFFAGILRQGKRRDIQKAMILRGPRMHAITVTEGKEAVLELGAPYQFEFKVAGEGEKVVVTGSSVVVVGSAGERYERLWGCVPRPEVLWRKAGQKKSDKGGRMQPALDLETINKFDWKSAWFPLDLEIEVKRSGEEPIEVQLSEKKNKLFGEIESDWRL